MKRDLIINEFIVEVTRKCNMQYAHCLRGKAQDMDIKFEYIRKALENVSQISSVVFTGGEPSLNVKAMEYFLSVCKEKAIQVDSFYIATNAKVVSEEFLLFISKMLTYCQISSGDAENAIYMSGIAPSVDEFHSDIPKGNIALLKSFSIFREDKMTTEKHLIYQGMAKEILDTPYSPHIKSEFYTTPLVVEQYGNSVNVDGYLYLSANGDIKTECNIEFQNDEFTIGNIQEKSLMNIVLTA